MYISHQTVLKKLYTYISFSSKLVLKFKTKVYGLVLPNDDL